MGGLLKALVRLLTAARKKGPAPASPAVRKLPTGATIHPSPPPMVTAPHQVQKKFKHAGDFGISGGYNKAKGEQYDRVLHDHVNASTTTPIDGTYHREPVIHHLDTTTGLNVVTKPDGQFVTAWKFNSDQLKNVTTHGGL